MSDRLLSFGKSIELKTFIATALLFVMLSSAFFFVTHTYHAYLNSDAAAANILAAEIWRSGQYFPDDWWYVNNDLWVIFKHLVIIPFAAVGKNGFGAHAASVIAGTLLLVGSATLLLRYSGATFAGALIGAAMLCLGYSDPYMEMVFGEGAYTWTSGFLFASAFLLLKIHAEYHQGRSRLVWFNWVLLSALSFFLVLANPSRYAVYYAAPLFMGVAVLALSNWRCILRLPTSVFLPRLAALLLGATLFLVVLILAWRTHATLVRELSVIQGASSSELVSLEALLPRLGLTLLGVINFFGVDWATGAKLSSVNGIQSILKLCLLPAIFIAPAIAAWHARTSAAAPLRFLTVVAYGGGGLIALMTAGTGLQGSNIAEAVYTTRYLTPFLHLLIILHVLSWVYYGAPLKIWVLAAFSIVGAGALGHVAPEGMRQQEVQATAIAAGFSLSPGWRAEESKMMNVVNQLRTAGLTKGFAPYWHSHVYTVLSHGDVEVRPLHMSRGEMRPWLHLSSSRWYKEGYANGKVFFLVPVAQQKAITEGAMKGCMPAPDSELRIDEYMVWVYDKNPLFLQVDQNMDAAGTVCLKSQGMSQIGEYDDSREAVIARKGAAAGLLRFGPYSVLPRGQYVITFETKIGNAPKGALDVGYVDVSGENGTKVLASKPISPTGGKVSLMVQVNQELLTGVEFRVYSSGISDMALESIQVHKVP